MFRDELNRYEGDITVWINSPGGDCFAASEIYTALKEHNGEITVKINGIAASAASVIAMAGDMVEMSPTSMIMIHNPSMMLYGQASELEQGIDFLNEVKESIINAYQIKTGLSRSSSDITCSSLRKSRFMCSSSLAICCSFCFMRSLNFDFRCKDT